MGYTVILVDDEDEVRGRIASKIEEYNEFEIIGSAANGYDALELLEERVPDVVITDIKMPFVDGIELTRIIKERFPTVGVAIISGYDDYKLLKDAINLDVIAYLSKPTTVENIKEFLKKIKKSLDEENDHIRLKENMVLTQMRNRIIHLYLNDYDLSMNHEEMKELGFDSKQKIVVVAIELIGFKGSIIEFEKKKNQSFLVAEETISQKFESIHTIFRNSNISIIKVTGEDFEKELDILLYKVINYLRKFVTVEIAIGVSDLGSFEKLGMIYRQSQMVLEKFKITNSSRINYYKDLKQSTELKTLSEEEIHEFKRHIRYMDKTEFKKYTKNLANKYKDNSIYDYFSIIITLSGLLLEYASIIDFNVNLFLDMNDIKKYVDSKDLVGFMELLYKLWIEMKEEVISRDTKQSNQIMDQIMRYIDDNYSRPDMSMDLVCDTFHISVSYLSALFKKESETTFNRYLVNKRIEHAKILLTHTDDKTVTIAEKCGYKDVYYFSHSFKKLTGQTPKGYKKNETV